MDIASAAFVLSSVLAAIRVYEFIQARRARLSLLVSLTGSSEIGNKLTLVNSSQVPAKIYYSTLVWVRPGFFSRFSRIFRKVISYEPPGLDYANIIIPPFERYEFVYSDRYHFDTGPDLKQEIYLLVWVSGRRWPKWFFVAGARNFSNGSEP